MQNLDGTANCDRCDADLPGFGVFFGMLLIHLASSGEVVNLIVCYDCASFVLEGLSDDE